MQRANSCPTATLIFPVKVRKRDAAPNYSPPTILQTVRSIFSIEEQRIVRHTREMTLSSEQK